jgi:hypothetical protein
MDMAIQANPDLMSIIGDLVFKHKDWPGADEISKRLHLALPPAILEAEQKSSMDKMSPEMQQATQQFDMAIQQKDESINAAADEIERLRQENEALKAQNELKAAEVQIKSQEAETNRFEAETARMVAFANANATEPVQQDNSGLEMLKLEYENEWKRLEADTKILVAKIAAESKNRDSEIAAETKHTEMMYGAAQADKDADHEVYMGAMQNSQESQRQAD